MLVALASMVEREAGRASLRLYGGFEIVVAILQQHGGVAVAAVTTHSAMLIARALSLLSVCTHDCPENHHHLWHTVGSETLLTILEGTGVLSSRHAPLVLERYSVYLLY